ncbi:MAG: alpha/beta hydrolase family protein [Candidatus Acidiferrales bacterium]
MNKSVRAGMAALAFLFLIPSHPAYAATGRAECQSMPSKILAHSVAYCILLPPTYDAEKTRRYPVLYFLHGLGDNEQMFLHSGGWNMAEDLWEQHQLGEFLIVTPAAGVSFYINSHDGSVRYEDFMLQEFLPFIEGHYRIRAGRAFRGVGGISMGGYGALRLAFRHPELFVSVTAQSAALIDKLPDIALGQSQKSARMQILGDVFGSPPERAFWEANNPLRLARSAKLARLKIYFDCGSEDNYGFDAGAESLHRVLASRLIPHEFHIYPGSHNWVYFAEHLPASLEFHAHAFGLRPSAEQIESKH